MIINKLYFVLLMKSHLQSYPCPLQINYFWNLGFLLTFSIIIQIITGIFLTLHYTSDLNSAYSSLFFFIREIYYGSTFLKFFTMNDFLMKSRFWKYIISAISPWWLCLIFSSPWFIPCKLPLERCNDFLTVTSLVSQKLSHPSLLRASAWECQL